eukprot:6695486-Pyramimonas_sp.AAC.1
MRAKAWDAKAPGQLHHAQYLALPRTLLEDPLKASDWLLGTSLGAPWSPWRCFEDRLQPVLALLPAALVRLRAVSG